MSVGRSPSAARQGGDDFQHLVAWNRILRALPEQRGLVAVEVEALEVGNVDDVVVRTTAVPDEFTQVRYGVDLAHPITTSYLTKSKPKGTSLLTKFHKTWLHLGGAAGRHPNLQLITNKTADPDDVLVRNVDGRTSTLDIALRAAPPISPLADVRRGLASHLGVVEEQLLDFLQDLHLRLGCQYASEAEHAASLMLASGMHYDRRAIRAGIDMVRQWVLEGRRVLEATEVRVEIERTGLVADEPWASLVVQAIDHDPHADDADLALDFVYFYPGEDPKQRRQLTASAYDEIHEELKMAAQTLRASGSDRVLVSGAMRLPTWFAAGEALAEVAGFTVLCGRANQAWASDPRATPTEVNVARRRLGDQGAVAVVVALATDPTEEVEATLTETGLPVSTILTVRAHDHSRVVDEAHANALAVAIKEAVRAELRAERADEVHLFMAAPAGLALLLGHTWNRVAPTTVWEDLGRSGYTPAYRFDG